MRTKKKEVERDLAKTYNEFKTFEGRRYTGMKVGGRHKWIYDKGEWNEKKVAPDRWEISYAVAKRRKGHAPPGSGVPVGSEYHWFILAHQNVRKLDENTYTTAMSGLKYKLAHKRADRETWSATERARRRQLIRILRGMIEDLEGRPEPVEAARPAKRNGKDVMAPAARRASTDGRRTPTRRRTGAAHARST